MLLMTLCCEFYSKVALFLKLWVLYMWVYYPKRHYADNCLYCQMGLRLLEPEQWVFQSAASPCVHRKAQRVGKMVHGGDVKWYR